MRRLISFTVAAIPVTLLATQTPADFTGRWIAVEPQKIAGHELVVAQDAGTLRLEQLRSSSGETYDEFGRPRGPQKGERESMIYRLDGGFQLRSEASGQSVRAFDAITNAYYSAIRITPLAPLSSAASFLIKEGGWCLSIAGQHWRTIRRKRQTGFSTSAE